MENLAGEIKQAINALIRLAQHCELEAELEASIDKSIENKERELGIQ